MGIANGRVRRPGTVCLLAFAVTLAVTLAIPGVAMGLLQNPVVKDAALTPGGTGITIEWTAATSGVGPIQYELWWNEVPMRSDNYSTIGQLAHYDDTTNDVVFESSDNTMTITVEPNPGEATAKFTYYYLIVAKDLGAVPAETYSLNITPQVHGGSRFGYSTENCRLCHTNVHGADGAYLGAATRWKCFRCHGATDAASTVGSHALRNVEGEFYDYQGQVADRDGDPSTWASQAGEWAGSRHYNADLVTKAQECTVCHSGIYPHRSPYYVDPLTAAYVATKSYTQLLEVELDGNKTPSSYFYSTDAVPAGNNFCFQCHGTNTTALDYNAGAGAYTNSGGDHQTPYSTAAHNATVVLTNTTATNPGIQCEACHNKHASVAGGLADWRSQRATNPDVNNQAGLCFQCHKTNSAESAYLGGSRIAGSTAPYSWRGTGLVADVYDQFKNASRKSTHPISAGGGRWVERTNQSIFSQTAQAEFETDTLVQTSAAAVPGSVVLNQFDASTPIPPELYLFSQRAGSLVVDAYRYDTGTTGTWNNPYAPANETSFNTATGSSLFTLGGDIYRTRGGNVTTLPMIRKFTLGTDNNGSWGNTAMTTAFNSGFNTGSAVADNASSSVVYISQGGGTAAINWWQYSGATENQMTFSGGNIGIGSGIAYTPDADRLWVILRTGATGAGTLWHRGTPGIRTGAQTFTDTGVVAGPSGGTSYYGRMAYFEGADGTDFLASMGRDGTARFFHVMSNLAGTPTRLRMTGNTKEPSGGGAYADGCSLVWDGVPGGYLYAQTTASTRLMRIKIPADPTVDGGADGWGTWEAVTNLPANMGAGSDLAFAMVDRPGSVVMPNYYGSGTITTGDINPGVDAVSWGNVTFTGTVPANTALTVTAQGWNGAWVDLATSATSPIDLSSFPVATYSKIRLRANFSTTDVIASTPRLDDWAVTSLATVWQSSGSLTCYSCHNTHAIEKGAAGVAWDLSRVSDPADIQSNFDDTGGTIGDFCLRCHNGTPPSTGGNTPTIFVPYPIGFRSFDAAASPFFFGKDLWNKSFDGADWANSRHNAVAAIGKDCGTCHDPHSSNFDNLTAYTGGATVRANTNAALSEEENLCYAASGCHNSAAGTANVQTPMSTTYSHTAENVTPSNHSDQENATGLGLGDITKRHSECADCHDPHAARAGVHTVYTSNPGEALRGASGIQPSYGTAFSGKTGEVWETMNAATGFSAERMTGEPDDFEAYVCLKCHSSYSGQPFALTAAQGNGRAYTSTDLALEFNPSNQSEHNVFGQQVGMEGSFMVDGVPYAMPLPADAAFLRPGWTSNSKVTCTDCHSNTTAGQARGPHGSATPWMMATGYVTWTATTDLSNMGTTVICAKCHQNLLSSNAAHADHGNRADCWDCHITIPHGWKRPRLLARTEDPAPYERGDCLTGSGITLRNRTGPNDWLDGNTDCAGGCDGRHNAVAPFWP